MKYSARRRPSPLSAASDIPHAYNGPLVTLGNMRENGVRTLDVWCSRRGCDHHRVLEVERYGDDVSVQWFGSRMRCERRGHLGADARPNWSEASTLARVGYNGADTASA